ncbi:LysR family transcriptional regulator [Bradyrhizobium roseum]|uniref:LysR family transcriptional regulator n=1 Tax=Bradyrhizobium roseum TaxID=3056648 RepID=UPI00262C3B5F|nr:LysR family transcriptional regulator [Bradyrhizobium roseus]WKA26788.1 LysR family transcriptional regulator [Bradyrhizobium roseus]
MRVQAGEKRRAIDGLQIQRSRAAQNRVGSEWFLHSKVKPLKQFTVGPALLAFARTVEHGSFAAAARTMNQSPAALGQNVARLEDFLGVRLLNRTTRTMSLTPEGRMLIERARGPLNEIEEISRIFEERRGKVSGPLRVSAPVGVARHQLVPLIARFAALHPAVHIELDASDEVRDFAEGAIDVSLRILRPQDSSVIARPITTLQALTLASPAYLKAAGVPAEPRDLIQHRCIGYRYSGTGRIADLHFRAGGKDVTMAFQPTLIVNDVEAACELAASGLGIVQPPSNYAAHYLKSQQLVQVLSRFAATPWRVYLCYPNRSKLPLRVRAFIEFARDHLKHASALTGFDDKPRARRSSR